MTQKITYLEHDLDIIARTLFGESVPRDKEDATAIAWVIRNRLEYKIHRWGVSIAKVCQAPLQFSCWNDNDPNRNRISNATYDANPWLRTCEKIAKSVLDGKVNDPTVRSTHYHTPDVHPSWSRGKVATHTTKGHLFFNDIDTAKPSHALYHRTEIKPYAVVGAGTVAGAGAVASIPTDQLIEAVQHVTPVVSALSLLDWQVACALLGVALVVGVWWLLRDRE